MKNRRQHLSCLGIPSSSKEKKYLNIIECEHNINLGLIILIQATQRLTCLTLTEFLIIFNFTPVLVIDKENTGKTRLY